MRQPELRDFPPARSGNNRAVQADRFLRLILGLVVWAAAARCEPADWIVTARYVITMDPARRVIEDGAVAVRSGRIVAVGPRAEIDRRYQARERLDRPEALIAPGLINTHAHAPMSLLRGLANDQSLQDWLEKSIFPAEARNVTPGFVRWGTRLACLEMLLSGTTTFADMYYFEDAVAEAAEEAGMRGVLGETIIAFPSPDSRTPEDGLRFAERFIQRFRSSTLIVPTVAPHSAYLVSAETLRAARALADRYSTPLIIHLDETRREHADALAKWNKTPTAELDALGILNGRTLAAHAVWVDDADIKILKARGTGVAHCPSSNMMLASGIAPVVRMLAEGANVGLGTDGPAGSNNDFDLMEEMDLAAKLQKAATGNPQALSAAQALEMATLGGARALGLEKEIGSLEPGKRADLITVRLDVPNAVPLYDVVPALVYSLKSGDVEDSMVEGRLVVRGRRVLTLDEPVVLIKAGEYGIKVKRSLGR
jgi:5-methylthioadenosine/S-adenosylhomocysteine deaminase